MEEEQVSQPITTRQPVTEETQEQPKPQNSSKTLTIFLVIVTIFSLCLSVYIAYQNYKMREIVAQMNLQSIESSPLPKGTPLPGNKENIEGTRYDNQTYNYSFLVPTGWEAFKQTGTDNVISVKPLEIENIPISISSFETEMATADEVINSQFIEKVPRTTEIINNISWVIYENKASTYESINYVVVENENYYIVSGSSLDNGYLNKLNDILSTFEFTNQ